jgi:hypothetical protein
MPGLREQLATGAGLLVRILVVVAVSLCTLVTIMIIATVNFDTGSEDISPLTSFLWLFVPILLPVTLGAAFAARIPGSDFRLIATGSVLSASGALLWWVGGILWMLLGWVVFMLGWGKMLRVRLIPLLMNPPAAHARDVSLLGPPAPPSESRRRSNTPAPPHRS